MQSLSEKKWFVYLGSRHEGPLSLEDIQGKMGGGQVSRESYVWTQGMADWAQMGNVEDFRPILEIVPPRLKPEAHFSEIRDFDRVDGNSDSLELRPQGGGSDQPQVKIQSSQDASSILEEGPSEPKLNEAKEDKGEEVKSLGLGEFDSGGDSEPEKRLLSKKVKILIQLLLLIGGAGYIYLQGYLDGVLNPNSFALATARISSFVQPYAMDLSEKLPFLETWVSPIPPLEGVSSRASEELKEAAWANLEKSGPKIALALSEKDPFQPYFYISTNLPNGVKFRIDIIGIPQTLLNRLSFQSHLEVTIQKKIGQSGLVRFMDGKPAPRGEYIVLVSPVQNQAASLQPLISRLAAVPVHLPQELTSVQYPDLKIDRVVASKTYFLSGKPDLTYVSRLKDYHEKLRVKALSELAELKQYMVTLDSQLEATHSKFDQLFKAGSAAKQKRNWDSFHEEWSKLQIQFHEVFEKWTPEMVKDELFYGPLYVQLQAANQSLEKVHLIQGSYFNGPVDSNSFHIQLGEATSSVQGELSILKSKIEQLEKTPLSPNGMPQRII